MESLVAGEKSWSVPGQARPFHCRLARRKHLQIEAEILKKAEEEMLPTCTNVSITAFLFS